MSRIGILGGTFNPPHAGHLALARHARDELGLERVFLMPVHAPHKPLASDPGAEHRLAMCRLATADQPGISACDLELRRPGPSYTADTLAQVHAEHPRAALTFIVGADTALTLPTWHDPQAVLGRARLAVAGREGAERSQVIDAVATVAAGVTASGQRSHEPHFLTMSPIEASSSLIRERLAARCEIDDLVGVAVARYIAEHGLYQHEKEQS